MQSNKNRLNLCNRLKCVPMFDENQKCEQVRVRELPASEVETESDQGPA